MKALIRFRKHTGNLLITEQRFQRRRESSLNRLLSVRRMSPIASLSPCTDASDWTTRPARHRTGWSAMFGIACESSWMNHSPVYAPPSLIHRSSHRSHQTLVREHVSSGSLLKDPRVSSLAFQVRKSRHLQHTCLIFLIMRPDLPDTFRSPRLHQRATAAAVPNSQIGIMLSSSGSKYKSYQLTYESAIIHPRNIERLFRGGELQVLVRGEEPSDAAPGDAFLPLLTVSDNL